jgi:hypothetical protein
MRGGLLALAGLLVAALLVPAGPAAAARPSQAEFEAMASFSAPDQTLRKGCPQDYWYSYTVNPPPTDWLLEITITDGAGVSQAFHFLTSGDPNPDPLSARRTFQICDPNVTAGTFTIRGKMTVRDYGSGPFDHDAEYAGWVKPFTFTVHPVPKAATKAQKRAAAKRAVRMWCPRAKKAKKLAIKRNATRKCAQARKRLRALAG